MCSFKIQNVPFSNTKNASFFSNKKMCSFQIRKCVHFKYENVSLSNTKNAPFSNTRMSFSNTKNVPLLNMKNKFVSNMKTSRFQKGKMWSVCIFKYECSFFQQTASHIFCMIAFIA